MKQKLRVSSLFSIFFFFLNFLVAQTPPFINEIHYDNTGADKGEGIEIAGPVGTDLSSYSVELYNGSDAKSDGPESLSGVIPDMQGGYGTVFFPIAGLQNGSPDGFALVKDGTEVVQFLSYEGTFTALDGPAAGMESEEIGVEESSTTAVGNSLQLGGSGTQYADFTWQTDLPNTYNKVNQNQNFGSTTSPATVFINELDADTDGIDTQEFIELYDGGAGNTSLDGLIIVLYNGSSDESYRTIDLTGYTSNQKGYFVIGDSEVKNLDLKMDNNFLQNGADAAALYRNTAADFPNKSAITTTNLLDAVVYGTGDPTDEGLLPLLNAGQLQLDEDVNGKKDSESLQRIPNGAGGLRNTDSFKAMIPSPGYENGSLPEQTDLLTILQAKGETIGSTVTITGMLTVSDQLGGPAYIQDKTGAITVYDGKVHGEGNFKIGDSITITGTLTSYNDQLEISPVERVDFNGKANKPIAPKPITLNELPNHADELVTIKDITFKKEDVGTLIFGNQNYAISDSSGSGVFRIDGDTDVFIGKAIPESCSKIIGVVADGYFNIIPRSLADFPCAEAYDNSGQDSSIPTNQTLDVAAWNIEWFGDENNSPAAGQFNSDEIQKNAVKEKIMALDADIIGVEEISDVALFKEMISEMNGYDYILSDATSYPDEAGGQRVGFIFKKDVFSKLSSRAMFTSVHPYYKGNDASLLSDYPDPDHSRFFASGRLPFMLTANVTINGETKKINFVELHARANTSGEAQNKYAMRKYDVEVLKDSLDTYYSDKNVVILGDYNDDVDETVADVSTNVSSYAAYAKDTTNYEILTKVLSEQGFRSYVSSDNMIDHITVSNELAATYIKSSARVHYEFLTSDYTSTASDHFPISVRMAMGDLSTASFSSENTKENITVFPNPTYGKTTISIHSLRNTKAVIEVYNLRGRVVLRRDIQVKNGDSTKSLNLSKLPFGIYIIRIKEGASFETAPVKLIKY